MTREELKLDVNKTYVLDTNIILQDASSIFSLSDNNTNLIILPETVLDEIDSKKSGFEEINFQARQFARFLEEAEIKGKFESEELRVKVVRIKVSQQSSKEKVIIDIISKNKYEANSETVERNISNDRKILEVSKDISDLYKYKKSQVSFLSMDIMARIRAISLGIQTEALRGIKIEETPLSFIKKVNITDEVIIEREQTGTAIEDIFSNKMIREIDPEFSNENFNYIFAFPCGREVLAMVVDEKIYLNDEDSLRSQAVNPRNREQLFLSQAIFEPNVNIVIASALAGSGKTLLSLSCAMKLVKKKEFSKILYVRNSVESLDKGEDIGYLAGNDAKFEIYNHPLYDSLEYIVRANIKNSNSNKAGVSNNKEITKDEIQVGIDKATEKYGIETMWVGEMRGRTISDAIVIIDEAQNISNKTMQLILSRIDDSSKIIILGSNNQIDNVYINKYTNSLTTLLNSTKSKFEEINLYAIELTRVLRGPITEFAEKIFTK